MPAAGAADEQHRHEDGREDERGPEVALEVDQSDRQPGEHQRRMSRVLPSSSPRCNEQYAATQMINATLAHSDGWNWNPPIWNHACVPLVAEPSGDSTSEQQRERADVEDLGEVAEAAVVDERDADHHDTPTTT